MRLALIGYGKMGKAIDRLAMDHGHEIVARIHPRDLGPWQLHDPDVCIEFSHPDCVLRNIERLLAMDQKVVVGTTGWHGDREVVRQMVEHTGTGLIYGDNFSIGMNLFLQVVEEAARLMNQWPQYDIGLNESHHRTKADSPSGTARVIAESLVKRVERCSTIDIASLRCGSIPGTHSVVLDSEVDTVTLTHQAHSRDGFALGAMEAARWVQGRRGFFDIKEVFLEEAHAG